MELLCPRLTLIGRSVTIRNEKPPAEDRRGFLAAAKVGCLWPEVALHAQQAGDQVLVGRAVEASRAVAAATEVERDL